MSNTLILCGVIEFFYSKRDAAITRHPFSNVVSGFPYSRSLPWHFLYLRPEPHQHEEAYEKLISTGKITNMKRALLQDYATFDAFMGWLAC